MSRIETETNEAGICMMHQSLNLSRRLDIPTTVMVKHGSEACFTANRLCHGMRPRDKMLPLLRAQPVL